MTTKELIKALKNKESRDNRALLDEAAERLDTLECIAEFYQAEASRLAKIINIDKAKGEEICRSIHLKK